MGDIKFEIVKKIAETSFKVRKLGNISKFDSVSTPSIFIGSKLKYPLVNVGIMSPLERDDDAWIYDAEPYWAKHDFGIKDVLKLRNSDLGLWRGNDLMFFEILGNQFARSEYVP